MVFKPDGAIGRCETEEDPCSRVGIIQFVEPDSWLLHGHMGAEHTNMCKVGSSSREPLIWSNVTREGGVGKAIFNVDRVADGV